MASRLDPPHDRVILTLEELRAVARLERSFSGLIVPEQDSPGMEGSRRSLRSPTRGHLRCVGLSLLLVVIIAAAVLVALTISAVAVVFGALVTGLGVAAVLIRQRRWPRR